jgi:hypothetical protein
VLKNGQIPRRKAQVQVQEVSKEDNQVQVSSKSNPKKKAEGSRSPSLSKVIA